MLIGNPIFTRKRRRKKKAVHKSVSNDDKRLQSVIKKMGMNAIPGIQEVNIFHTDTVTHFVSPKGRVFLSTQVLCFNKLTVQAAVHANAYVVSGHSETKRTQIFIADSPFPNSFTRLGRHSSEHRQSTR